MLSNNSTNLWPLQGVFVLFSKKNRSFSSICGLGQLLEAHPAQGIAFAEHEVVLEQPVLIAPLLLQGGQLVRGGAVLLPCNTGEWGIGKPQLILKSYEAGMESVGKTARFIRIKAENEMKNIEVFGF